MKPMMQRNHYWMLASAAMLVALPGCDKVADTSRAVQSVTHNAFDDTRDSWKDFFTYHPPQPEPLPQTRYCYQMQSDVVCYDSEQTTLTSKLVGFQDGETISWVQPGGGSLGASGGPPVALRPAVKYESRTGTNSFNDFLPFEWPKFGKSAGPAPTESSAPTDQIGVNNLPPINSVATVGQTVR